MQFLRAEGWVEPKESLLDIVPSITEGMPEQAGIRGMLEPAEST